MNILDILSMEESKLGKSYNEWTNAEKITFAHNVDLDNMKNIIENVVHSIDLSVSQARKEYLDDEEHNKVERYVSLSDIMQFLNDQYKTHVFNNGIKKIANKFKSITYLTGFELFTTYHLSSIDIDLVDHSLNVSLRYLGLEGKMFKIIENHGNYFIKSDGFSSKEEKYIFNKINYKQLFDYCTMIGDISYDLKGIYNTDTITEVIPISISMNSIDIGDGFILYNISPTKCNFVMQSTNFNDETELGSLLNGIYANDKEYLTKILVKYSDLPIYIQENIFTNNSKKSKELVK